MVRRGWFLVAVVASVAVAMFGSASRARAVGTGEICKKLSAAGHSYEWSAIGNVTCNQAKPWLLKIVSARQPASGTIKNGPKGFKCHASVDSKGRPFAGACYTGTAAFPKNGFQWLG